MTTTQASLAVSAATVTTIYTPPKGPFPEACCAAAGALRYVAEESRPDLEVWQCATCARRHRVWSVPPISVGVRLT